MASYETGVVHLLLNIINMISDSDGIKAHLNLTAVVDVFHAVLYGLHECGNKQTMNHAVNKICTSVRVVKFRK